MRLYSLTRCAQTLNCKPNTSASGSTIVNNRIKTTAANVVKFRINQEIKFQYKRKQHLNQQLYHSHPECARHYNVIWQHIQTIIDQHLHQRSGTHLHTESTYTHQMLCCRISTLTFTFLTNFKISDFNKEHKGFLKMV